MFCPHAYLLLKHDMVRSGVEGVYGHAFSLEPGFELWGVIGAGRVIEDLIGAVHECCLRVDEIVEPGVQSPVSVVSAFDIVGFQIAGIRGNNLILHLLLHVGAEQHGGFSAGQPEHQRAVVQQVGLLLFSCLVPGVQHLQMKSDEVQLISRLQISDVVHLLRQSVEGVPGVDTVVIVCGLLVPLLVDLCRVDLADRDVCVRIGGQDGVEGSRVIRMGVGDDPGVRMIVVLFQDLQHLLCVGIIAAVYDDEMVVLIGDGVEGSLVSVRRRVGGHGPLVSRVAGMIQSKTEDGQNDGTQKDAGEDLPLPARLVSGSDRGSLAIPDFRVCHSYSPI